MKKHKILIICLVGIFAISCKSPKNADSDFVPTKQQRAEDAIKSWMLKNNEHPYYKPIVFGDVTPRYEKTDRSFHLSVLIEEEQILSPEGSQKLDSLKSLLNENPGNLLGYIVLHKYSTTNIAGETFNLENLFFLDTAFRVASMLTPESFDMILDENRFYKLDSIE